MKTQIDKKTLWMGIALAACSALLCGCAAVSGQVQPGSGTKPGIGTYSAAVVFTNSAKNTRWFPPAAGKTHGVITDIAHQNYNPPYSCVVEAVEYPSLQNWYAANTVNFPVRSGCKYQFTTYIKNVMPPPPRGTSIKLEYHLAALIRSSI